MNIALIGYRATGKTTVAKLLAQRLPGWNCFDADVEIEKAAGQTIAEIFRDFGEDVFRDWEARVTAQLLTGDNTIIATGGGVVIRPENRVLLKKNAFVVWLKAMPETIYQRMYSDQTTASRRPALTQSAPQEEIVRLLELRTPWYEQTAHAALDTENCPPEEIARKILLLAGIKS